MNDDVPGSLSPDRFAVKELGARTVVSPMACGGTPCAFVADDARIPVQVEDTATQPGRGDLFFQKAGPREHLFFEPAQVRAAVVTAGGLCPGLNNVIRSLVQQLHHGYGVRDVIGIRYGYGGMAAGAADPPLRLTPALVADIHRTGGTVIGTSRVELPPAAIVDFLVRERVNVLFTIGGDGTLRGAHALSVEAEARGYPLAVIGLPKTIDNDIPFVWRSFGYFTAVEKAREVIDSAHNEAVSHRDGVAIIRLMGRDAGFIAAGATLASQEVNFTLIPEIPFALEGAGGLLAAVQRRLAERHHAVIVVAEGAGQALIPAGDQRYVAQGRSGFKNIGTFLRDQIAERCHADVKYFDPSYFIRSAAADAEDALLCDQLARNAVHAAMAGKTDVLIGLWYNVNTHVPIELAVSHKKRIRESNEIWRAVLQTTGQPARFV